MGIIELIGLIIAAIIAITAMIGLLIASQQPKTAQQQQSETAQRSLLNERYQKGAKMLGSAKLSTRLGGIYALERLARECVKDYHIQIIKLFCDFVRNPPKDENDNDAPKVRKDVQVIMTALGRRNYNVQQGIEKRKIGKEPILNLAGADLSGSELKFADLSNAVLKLADLSNAVLEGANLSHANLDDTNLSGAELYEANLYGARLHRADLSGARLHRADLSGAELYEANLYGARLHRTKLSGAELKRAHGLTQAQLDRAVVELPEKPPHLGDAKDSETGKPLVLER